MRIWKSSTMIGRGDVRVRRIGFFNVRRSRRRGLPGYHAPVVYEDAREGLYRYIDHCTPPWLLSILFSVKERRLDIVVVMVRRLERESKKRVLVNEKWSRDPSDSILTIGKVTVMIVCD